MKYSYPRINDLSLKKAADIFNQRIQEYKSLGMKLESDLVGAFFDIINRFFSQFRKPALSRNMRVKEDPPRTAAISSEYNRFIRALELDMYGSYSDQSEVDRNVPLHFNYAQSNRVGIERGIKRINDRLTNLAVMSQSSDTRDIWFKDSFNTDKKVDTNYTGYTYRAGIVNTNDGIFELPYTDTDDILTMDNVEDIDDSNISIDNAFVYSDPYRGRRYGVISEDGNSDESPRPDIDIPGSIWTDRTVRNLIDPDEVDSYWEVEVTAREGMSELDYNKTNKGPYFFLKDSGEPDDVSRVESATSLYRYSRGYLCYNEKAYRTEFFYDTKNQSIRRLVSAQLVITLKDTQYMSNIRITRKPINSNGIDGQGHMIYVSSIETRDTATDWKVIPSFNQLESYRSSNHSVRDRAQIITAQDNRNNTIQSTIPSKVVRGSRTGDVTTQRSRITKSRGSTTVDRSTRGQASVGSGSADLNDIPASMYRSTESNGVSIIHIDDILKPSDSKFSKASSWSFPTRSVKAIRIVLYTDIPYNIRYSMGKYTIGDKKKSASVFIQYSEVSDPYDVGAKTVTTNRAGEITTSTTGKPAVGKRGT